MLVLAICAVFCHTQVARGQTDATAAVLADSQSPDVPPAFFRQQKRRVREFVLGGSFKSGRHRRGERGNDNVRNLARGGRARRQYRGPKARRERGRRDASGGMDDFQHSLSSECPTWGVQTFVSYDSWKGLSDDGWQNNGINVGASFGTRLGPWGDAIGLGFQIGGSVGVYDWSGTDYHNAVETQGFITYGFFRRPTGQSGWTAGIIQDWMLNQNFGEFSQIPPSASSAARSVMRQVPQTKSASGGPFA